MISLGVVAALAALVLARLVVASRDSQTRPPGLGVTNGRLAPGGARPNHVATEGAAPERTMAPLPFSLDEASTRAKLKAVVSTMPGARIVDDRPGYLAAELRSRLFGFVDDVEFRLDEQAKLVHFRSASRQGYSDMGVNRKRMEAVGSAYAR